MEDDITVPRSDPPGGVSDDNMRVEPYLGQDLTDDCRVNITVGAEAVAGGQGVFAHCGSQAWDIHFNIESSASHRPAFSCSHIFLPYQDITRIQPATIPDPARNTSTNSIPVDPRHSVETYRDVVVLPAPCPLLLPIVQTSGNCKQFS